MKKVFRHIALYFIIPAVVGVASCSEEEEAAVADSPSKEEMNVGLQMQSQMPYTLNGEIRVLAFNAADKLIKEFSPIAASQMGQTQTIGLPSGQNKIILLGNANPVLGVDPLGTALVPGVTSYTDIMFKLQETAGLTDQPMQFYYGKDEFNLQPGPLMTRNVVLQNLTSKVRFSYQNGFADLFDSTQVWIENTGKEITFNGTTTSVGTTRHYSFVKGSNGLLKADSFLVFPSISTIPTVIKAKFYLNNHTTIDFSKNIGYVFIPNKILQFIFNIDGLQANIDLNFQVLDWDTPADSQSISGNLVMALNGGVPTNYTYADLSLTYHFSDTYSYSINFPQVPLQSVNGQSQIVAPLNRMELGNYTLESVQLYDSEGSFAALPAPVDFRLQLNDNMIVANIIGRSAYEQALLKQWLLVFDGNSGNTYPGASIINQINNSPTYNPFTDDVALGLSLQTINGEQRLTGLNINNRGISTLNVPAYATSFTKLTTLSCAKNSLTSLILSALSYLKTVNLDHNSLASINLSGCKNLAAFDAGFITSDYQALKTLNCSNTSITQLSGSLTELTALYWSGCGLTDSQVIGISGYHKLVTLDISNNKLTVYPDFATLVGLGVLSNYSVKDNDIVSCALSYMNLFGENNILNQRTGFNFWCP